MDDERTGEGQRQPLWPPDAEPELPLEAPTTPESPNTAHLAPAPDAHDAVSEMATERIPAAHATPALSEAATERMPATPAPQPAETPTHRLTQPPATVEPSRATPQASEIPTHHLSQPPATPTPKPVGRGSDLPLPAPLRPSAPARRRGALAWSLAHWPLLTFALVIVLLGVTALGVYNYAQALAAQPGRLVASYCAALTSASYKTAFSLQASSLQAQTTLAQYEADAATRDTISGRITACAGVPAQKLSAISFLKNPRSLVFNLTLTRASGVEHGQLALSRDATGWHVAALSASVSGIDLGPLHTEEALCQAFVSRDYTAAYGLLSTPFQKEQGSEAAFARAFGANLAITGCAPTLKGYTVNSADQRASFQVTLNVAVTGGGASTKLTLPAMMTLVRDPDGWRVDTITPTLSQ